MNKVPVGLFIIWAVGLVGGLVFLGLYVDASNQGRGWLVADIASWSIFAGGLVWYFVKGNRG